MFAVVYALAISAVLASGASWGVKSAAILCLTVLASWHIATRALLWSPSAVCRLVWQSEGECEWQLRNGRFRCGELLPGLLVTPTLVVFRVKSDRLRQRTFCIARDGVDDEAMRRLRVRLKVSPPPGPPSLLKRIGDLLAGRGRSERFADDEKPTAPP
jgi:hypothetical protein